MNKIFFDHNGLTLTELIVASVMIGIVMMGVGSFSVAIKQLHGSTSRTTITSMRVKSVMARISQDAFLAVGDGTDRGILEYAVGTNMSICFRQDDNNTPIDYTDDAQICYLQALDDDSDPTLYSCGSTALPTPPTSRAQCNAGGDLTRILDLDPAEAIFYDVVENGSGQLELIEITLTALFDHGTAEHPVTNPSHSITTQVNPPGHSR